MPLAIAPEMPERETGKERGGAKGGGPGRMRPKEREERQRERRRETESNVYTYIYINILIGSDNIDASYTFPLETSPPGNSKRSAPYPAANFPTHRNPLAVRPPGGAKSDRRAYQSLYCRNT